MCHSGILGGFVSAAGMPPVTNEYDSSLGAQAEGLAKAWHTCDVMGVGSGGPKGASSADIAGWGAEQVCYFLVRAPGSAPPPPRADAGRGWMMGRGAQHLQFPTCAATALR